MIRETSCFGEVPMDDKCKKTWRVGVRCSTGHALAALPESEAPTPAPRSSSDHAGPRGIEFGVDARAYAHLTAGVTIPGYDAPALPLKPVRDPSLSLVALSGIDPSGSVMVEVPLVQNNTTFTAAQALAGRRVGFAEHFVLGHGHAPIQHRTAFLNALDTLRRAGAQLVPVPAQRVDASLQFNLHTRNEIDAHMSEYRLDALVSDSRTAAFHTACWSGYPGLGEPLEEGATLWFYGARWSKESLAALVREYRNVLRQSHYATASDGFQRLNSLPL
jgi:hypothetical protein